MDRAEVTARLREMAHQVIGTAERMLAAVANGAEPIGLHDPEPWRVKRWHARRILRAINNGTPVKLTWLEGIARATAGLPHPPPP